MRQMQPFFFSQEFSSIFIVIVLLTLLFAFYMLPRFTNMHSTRMFINNL